MTDYALVKKAIQTKSQIVATYNGHRRKMCPHVIGRKGSRRQALFYQFGGTSSSGLEPDGSPDNWRCIPIRGLRNVEIREGEWHTAPNHSQPQTCVDFKDVEVQY